MPVGQCAGQAVNQFVEPRIGQMRIQLAGQQAVFLRDGNAKINALCLPVGFYPLAYGRQQWVLIQVKTIAGVRGQLKKCLWQHADAVLMKDRGFQYRQFEQAGESARSRFWRGR